MSPECYEVRTVTEDEVVQHVRVEAGEGPGDGTAPVVTNQGELTDPQTLQQPLDIVRQLLQMRDKISTFKTDSLSVSP